MAELSRYAILLAVLLCLTSIWSQRKTAEDAPAATATPQKPKRSSWLDDDHLDASATKEAEGNTEHLQQHASSSYSGHSALIAREEKVAMLEMELSDLRDGRMREALDRAHRTEQLLRKAKSDAGWFASSQEKERVQRLDAEFERNMMAVAAVQNEEKALQTQLKPLYGIVSFPFYAEQRNTIKSCISKVQEMSYNNAWYSGLFNAHRAESITDIFIQFFIEWLVGYVIMYPFAVLYYALWAAPWSIYEYSSGATDVVVGAVAWATSVVAMLLPLLALAGGAWLIFVKYGDQIAQHMRERQRQAPRPRPQAYPGRLGGQYY